MRHDQGFLDVVGAAKSKIRETDVATVRQRQERGDKFHFVDVREDDEWRAGHALGAMHIGKGVIERDVEKLIPDKSAEVILYCGGGFRSALAAEAIQRMGYTNVLSMDGGYRGWRDADNPIES